MTLDPRVLLAIVGMALATYATRAGGYVLFKAFHPGETARAMLGYIPGALFVAYVAPALAAGSWPEWTGALAAVTLMRTTANMSAAIIGGTAAAWLVWAVR